LQQVEEPVVIGFGEAVKKAVDGAKEIRVVGELAAQLFMLHYTAVLYIDSTEHK